MGSATRKALESQASAVAAAEVSLETARELFTAANALASSPALTSALTDASAPAAVRAQVVEKVFASFSATTRALLAGASQARWSSAQDFVRGVEETAVRVTARAETADIEGELFQVGRIVASNAELELSLGSRLGSLEKKAALVERLLDGTASEGTTLVVSSLVRLADGRRVRALLAQAGRIVASQRGSTVATVTSAAQLSDEQVEHVAAALGRRYGTTVSINQIVDPSVIGGLRVQIADEVIDGSISARIADLRQKLAG